MGKSDGRARAESPEANEVFVHGELTVKGTISIEEVDLTTVSQEDQHRIFQNYAMTQLNISFPIKGPIVNREIGIKRERSQVEIHSR